ncbi:MAG: hypothetical protein A2Z72_07700 [Omnitrophica bacterium RBG_13_46_9]|nr:MAG: hypothetical protein A2Z72_07700 [Omnitrophica bacterium RBG_13_46_9]
MTEKMLGAEHPLLLPEEQDLGEMVDTFLGNRLSADTTQRIRQEYEAGIKDRVAGYNTAVNYDYVSDEGPVKGKLGLELLAARYVTRLVKDNLMKIDVSHMREEEDFMRLTRQHILVGGQHLFLLTSREEEPGVYGAQFEQRGEKASLALEHGQQVMIRLFPVEEGSKLKAGDAIEELRGETVVTFDKNGIVNNRHVGVLVTTRTGGVQSAAPAVSSVRTRVAEMANKVLSFLRQVTELGSIIDSRPVDRDDVSASIVDRARSAAQAIRTLKDTPHAIDKRQLAETEEVASQMAENLDNLEADGIVGTALAMAKTAKADDQNLIIGLETEWIPGCDRIYGGRMLQHSAINPLIKEIESLEKNLRRMGLDNVKVIHDEGDSLAKRLLATAGETKTKLTNVVVLASKGTIESDAFSPLRSTKTDKRAFLAGVDDRELDRFYGDFGEAADKQLYIRIMEMLSITLELASGKEAPDLPIIMSYDKEARTLIFLPRAEPMNYQELQERYQREREALIAA